MREIKFRAWDAIKREFVPLSHAMAWPTSAEVASREHNRYVPMQYTGLKDKNGVEIYEGDIFEDDEDGSINWVEYDADYAGFTTNGRYGGWWAPKELAEHAPDYEVIGNIYENPELLGESNANA